MRQCLSGMVGDGYQTMCMGIDYDNNVEQAGSYCFVALGQSYVSDGCYIAMPNTTGRPTGLIIEIVVPIGASIVILILAFVAAYKTSDKFRTTFDERCGCCRPRSSKTIQVDLARAVGR